MLFRSEELDHRSFSKLYPMDGVDRIGEIKGFLDLGYYIYRQLCLKRVLCCVTFYLGFI